MQEYIDNNRKLWDGMVPVHVDSDFYDVASFKAGRNSLLGVERSEVGNVEGRSMLHLQCHFGMDTLSWARLGATVTGVDFSGPAIVQARELAAALGLNATFIESDVYKLPDVLDSQFDIVFASYGAICWLPDFEHWMQIAARYVKPGGFFYVIDGHPLSWALDDERPNSIVRAYSTNGHRWFSTIRAATQMATQFCRTIAATSSITDSAKSSLPRSTPGYVSTSCTSFRSVSGNASPT